MKIWVIFVFLLLIPAAAGQIISDAMIEEAKIFAAEVQEFIGESDVIIVIGNDCSKTERLLFSAVKDRFPNLADVEVITENELSEDRSELKGKTVFLLGGPQQNALTSASLSMEGCEITEKQLSIGVLSYMTDPEGNKFVIVSDASGYHNVRRTGPKNSPLARFIPEEYVPAAAVAIGITLLWIWNFLFPIIKKILRLFLSAKVMDKVTKREWKPKYIGFHIFGIRFKVREWMSIFGAATVFALAIAYGYFHDSGFLALIGATVMVNLIIYGIRHLTRLVMDKRHEIHTEYVFWLWGGIITVFTGWLGNTFSLAGYTLSDKDKTTAREAKIVWLIDFFTFLAGMFFLVWNFFFPSITAQMAMILALGIAVIQMLPMKPFGGLKVWHWRRGIWFMTFIPLACIYVLIHLI